MGVEERRLERIANWAEMAAGWERAREYREKVAAPVTDWLVRALAPREGQTVLELAAGQGDVGYAVAPIVGESGRVISSDFSPGMVEIADRRREELGLTNVAHRVFDAEQIELEDDSVDGVLCRFGYMLMPDPAAALRETRRVLRPDGRLALAVWSSGDRNPWMAAAGRILVGRGYMPAPEPGEPGMFVLGDENELRRLLEESDFVRIRIEAVPVHFDYSDVDDYIRRANETGGMFARAWNAAPEAEQEAMKNDFRDAFAPFAVDGGYELPGLALCALAS